MEKSRGVFAYADFNLDALLSLATKLRPGCGRPCTVVDPDKRPRAGSMNWAVFLLFDDGVEWVFRSPRGFRPWMPGADSPMFTNETAAKMLRSEAATLKYIKAHSSVPVPGVYSYSDSCENEIGVSYILMSKVPGRLLREYDWIEDYERLLDHPTRARRHLLPLTDENRQKIMSQIGAMLAGLSKLRFHKIGSLFEDSGGNCSVGECLSPVLLWQWRDKLDGLQRGPFGTEGQYFDALISAFVSHVRELDMGPHYFFSPLPDPLEFRDWAAYREAVERAGELHAIDEKMWGAENRLAYCVAGELLRDMVPHLASAGESEEGGGGFVLSHPDFHQGNVFVDDDFNVTGIIDWGSAHAGPVGELLAPPRFSGSHTPETASLVAAFRAGFEKGRGGSIAPELWQKADRVWHVSRLVRLLSTQDYTHFHRLYALMHGEAAADDVPRLIRKQFGQEDNKRLLAELRTKHEPPLEEQEAEEEPYEDMKTEGTRIKEQMAMWRKIEEGRKSDTGKTEGKMALVRMNEERKTERFSIAKKLALMAERNPNFVADKRLWRWIEDALVERTQLTPTSRAAASSAS